MPAADETARPTIDVLSTGGSVIVALRGEVRRTDIPRLSREARSSLLATGVTPVVCDVAGLQAPGIPAVDVLARMQLAARELGRALTLSGASDRLVELLRLVGLSDVLPPTSTR